MDSDSTVAAELGDLALAMTYTRWLAPASDAAFADLAHEALDELRGATAALSLARPEPRPP
ncbi:hypothetical protein [Dactylosporangium sp. CA-092794]|uniref:hypothetical protein n=1 Tax=Dactylosporangium sp. CA-092794 TaxID=3239929 RepID=UPI003D90DF42